MRSPSARSDPEPTTSPDLNSNPRRRFEDEGAKERAAKLEEENAALQERLAKALEVAARASTAGGTAAAAAVGNGEHHNHGVVPNSTMSQTCILRAAG